VSDGIVRTDFSESNPHVLIATIDRPPVNAMSPDMYRQLHELFESLPDRPDVRCVVLTGAGPKSFIAGADVKQLAERTAASVAERSRISRRAYEAIRLTQVPTIAAVNGVALGSGFLISSVCDFIIAAEHARFAIPEIQVGALGGSRHASRVLPEKVMRYLVLTGERVDAAFLHRMGMIHEVVPAEQLMPAVLALADKLTAISPRLMRLRKESLTLTNELPILEGYRVEQLYTELVASDPEAAAAARAVRDARGSGKV
jgi:enoyl-CoA hydratase